MEGNQMKMREACKAALSELYKFGQVHDGRIHLSDIVHVANARGELQEALSEPPRQCDIGTAEEQDDRWESFCASHHSPWKITGGTGTMICDCPCYKGNNKCNRFAWAQTPYAEEGGAK